MFVSFSKDHVDRRKPNGAGSKKGANLLSRLNDGQHDP
jgi:hypothetical protein